MFVLCFVLFISLFFVHLCNAVIHLLQFGFTCTEVIILLPLKDTGDNINRLQTKPKNPTKLEALTSLDVLYSINHTVGIRYHRKIK